MTTTHHTFCRICEALCGLEADVHDGKVASGVFLAAMSISIGLLVFETATQQK